MTPEGKTRLILDEGYMLVVYDDATDLPVRHLTSGGNATIGIGRNLTGRGISLVEAMFLFNNDILSTELKLTKAIPFFTTLDPVWQDVLTMIDFNTGNVLEWSQLLNDMKNNQPLMARTGLLNSRAAFQLPTRYGRMADAIVNKAWPKPESPLPVGITIA